MSRIFTAGIKHSGKTLLSCLAADRLGMDWADGDGLFEKLAGVPARTYYREHGNKAFLEKQFEAVKAWTDGKDDYIVSLGGGVSDSPEFLSFIADTGKMVYIRRDEKAMLPVILQDGIPPFLITDEGVEEAFHKLYMRRDPIYSEHADIILDLHDYGEMEDAVNLLIAKLLEAGYVKHDR